MPASNRRPLYEDAGAPQSSDIKLRQPLPEPAAVSQQLSPASTPAAAFAAPQASFKQPCTLKGAASALYAGALGYFLGVVPATIKFKARQWGMIHIQGLASAQQLAVMSGMYTAVHCICQRIRMVEDGWNRGIAGCSTGLVLGWNNGPWSALQSCAGLGLLSALIDLGSGVEAAEARMLQPLLHTQNPSTHKQPQQQCAQSAHLQEGAERQHWGAGVQALLGLPQAAQLVALLMGASPANMGGTATPSSSNSRSTAARRADEQASDTQQAHEQQQRPIRRSSKSDAQQAAGELHGLNSEPWRQQQQPMQQQQQPLAAAALVMHPAARAVQQLMLTAPPLMFLGACCHTNAAGSSTATVADADVDGCPLAVSSAAAAAGRSRGH